MNLSYYFISFFFSCKLDCVLLSFSISTQHFQNLFDQILNVFSAYYVDSLSKI